MIADDALLPSQFYATRGVKADAETEGTRKLLLEVLKDAIECFLGGGVIRSEDEYVPTRKRLRQMEAEHWIFVDGGYGPFAYRNLTDALGIDGDALREGLARRRGMPLHFPKSAVTKNQEKIGSQSHRRRSAAA